MTPTFEILAQSSDKLVVHSPIVLFSWIILVPMAFGDAVAVFFYSRMPRNLPPLTRSIPLWIGLLITLFFVFTAVWSHTMTLSRPEGTASIEDKFAGITYSNRRVPLPSIERAVLESARPGTRIALILRGGEPIWPFGKGYNPRPNQYTVIDDINEFIGAKTSTAPGTEETPDELERRLNKNFQHLENEPNIKPQ